MSLILFKQDLYKSGWQIIRGTTRLVKRAKLKIRRIYIRTVKKLLHYRLGCFVLTKFFRARNSFLVTSNAHPRLFYASTSLVVALVCLSLATLVYGLSQPNYALTKADLKLTGPADTTLMASGHFSLNHQSSTYYLNKSAIKSSASSSAPTSVTVGNNSADYSLALPTNLSQGVSVYDNKSNLSFSLKPQFSTAAGKLVNNHLVYPLSSLSGADAVYTVKGNGLQEDVILSKPTNNLSLSYQLSLPAYLTARSLSDGAIGIYSANPALFGNISYGDAKDQLAVAKAKLKSPKNYLVFVLLPPVVKSTGSLATNTKGVKTSLTIKGNKLTLVASNLEYQTYPISIDPSVLVTSATGFGTDNNEGDMNVGTNLSVAGLTGATINSWTATTSFTATSMPARYAFGAVAYNGYLYVMGGEAGAASGDCATSFCNGTFYAPINANGTI
ncbi:MAG: hypothetical protein ACREF5_02310, partial [Candidatus Saccharimonadales bacterium]